MTSRREFLLRTLVKSVYSVNLATPWRSDNAARRTSAVAVLRLVGLVLPYSEVKHICVALRRVQLKTIRMQMSKLRASFGYSTAKRSREDRQGLRDTTSFLSF